jgi:hypothetical protein
VNKIHRFYHLVFEYLKFQPEADDVARKKILGLASECGGLSWEATDDELQLLGQCVNRGSSVINEELWSKTREGFVLAAFKDLSPMKNPLAMETFRNLQEICLFEISEYILWARKIMKRDDGTAVIVLHVSDFSRFEKLVNEQTPVMGDLENGVMIGY